MEEVIANITLEEARIIQEVMGFERVSDYPVIDNVNCNEWGRLKLDNTVIRFRCYSEGKHNSLIANLCSWHKHLKFQIIDMAHGDINIKDIKKNLIDLSSAMGSIIERYNDNAQGEI